MNTLKTPFATCFEALLNAKVGYNNARWARYLVVSRAAITQWTGGRHIPGPDKLLKVLAKFAQPTTHEQEALDAFQEMADLPIASVTDQPQKFKGAATISDYICQYRLQNIGYNAQSLPLQVRLEAISHYAAVTQALDENFAVPGKKTAAFVRAVVQNMKRFREAAVNFDFLFADQRAKPHQLGRNQDRIAFVLKHRSRERLRRALSEELRVANVKLASGADLKSIDPSIILARKAKDSHGSVKA